MPALLTNRDLEIASDYSKGYVSAYLMLIIDTRYYLAKYRSNKTKN